MIPSDQHEQPRRPAPIPARCHHKCQRVHQRPQSLPQLLDQPLGPRPNRAIPRPRDVPNPFQTKHQREDPLYQDHEGPDQTAQRVPFLSTAQNSPSHPAEAFQHPHTKKPQHPSLPPSAAGLPQTHPRHYSPARKAPPPGAALPHHLATNTPGVWGLAPMTAPVPARSQTPPPQRRARRAPSAPTRSPRLRQSQPLR